jgi:signal transduction histidine kinase/ActR/RegA family two-component response regulator
MTLTRRRSDTAGGSLEVEARRRRVADGIAPALGHLIAASMVAVMVYGKTSLASILVWLVALFAAVLVREALQRKHAAETTGRRGLLSHRITSGALALVWGIGAGLAVGDVPFRDVALILAIISALVAGATMTLAPDRVGFRIYLGAMFVPLGLGLLLEPVHSFEMYIAAALLPLFAAFMLRLHRSTNDALIEKLAALDALEGSRDAAENANRAKSEFLATMSHELRTPLNSVIGFAGVLLRNKAGHLKPDEVMYLQRIRDNGQHLLGLINNVLDLSKVESGRMEVEYADVALAPLLAEIAGQLQPQARERHIALTIECPAETTLRTDASKLRQIVVNLVANALKFTEQGTVTVRVHMDDASGKPACIDVVDTGIGIPRERQEAVFEAFQQADSSTTRRYGGTGLGLAITRSLCNLLGYEVSLESAVGAGSTFRILLVAGAVIPATVTAPPAAAQRRGGRRVLVIDDDADARLLLREFLEEAGCDVETAGSGTDGLRIARAHPPDLITLDLIMPCLNGYQVLEALKADPNLASIPVVIVSIVAKEQRGRVLGAVATLEKPLQRAELEAVLRRYLAEPATVAAQTVAA